MLRAPLVLIITKKYNNYCKYSQYILYDFSGHKPPLEGKIKICYRYRFTYFPPHVCIPTAVFCLRQARPLPLTEPAADQQCPSPSQQALLTNQQRGVEGKRRQAMPCAKTCKKMEAFLQSGSFSAAKQQQGGECEGEGNTSGLSGGLDQKMPSVHQAST